MGTLLKTVGRSVLAGESSLGVVGASCLWGPFTRGDLDAVGDISVRAGAFDAVGGPESCPRTRRVSPTRGGVHPAAWNVPGRRR